MASLTNSVGSIFKSPYFALTIVPLIWASNFIVGKELVNTVPPFTVSATRSAIAFLGLLPVFLYNQKIASAGTAKQSNLFSMMKAKTWLLLFFLGLSGVFAFSSMLYFGLKQTSAVNGSLINAISPTLTVLLSLVILREKPLPRQLLALVLSFFGVVWISIQGQLAKLWGLSFNPGDVIILLAALIWAIYSVGVKKAVSVVSPLTVTIISMLFGLMLLLPASYLELSSSPLGPLTWKTVLALAYLGVFPSVICFLLWAWGIGKVGPTKASMFYNLIPPFAAIMNYLFLGEVPKVYHFVGGLLVLWGVYLGIMPGGKAQVKPEVKLSQAS